MMDLVQFCKELFFPQRQKYKVNFATGKASIVTADGEILYTLKVDKGGVYVTTSYGKVYMTEENSIVESLHD